MSYECSFRVNDPVTDHPVVSHDEWTEARKKLLAKEKEYTRLGDELNEARRALPWEKVGKDYIFEGPTGKVGLADLFKGRRQLIVYHFMYGPGWEEGCVGCSHFADNVDSARQHFEQADASFAAISRGTLPELDAFKKRMGWNFEWVSSYGSDFNHDYGVSFTPEEVASGKIAYNYGLIDQVYDELPGLSVFYKDEAGNIFHTYSTYGRGLDHLLGAHHFLDLTPKGRSDSKEGEHWLDYHDKYGSTEGSGCACS